MTRPGGYISRHQHASTVHPPNPHAPMMNRSYASLKKPTPATRMACGGGQRGILFFFYSSARSARHPLLAGMRRVVLAVEGQGGRLPSRPPPAFALFSVVVDPKSVAVPRTASTAATCPAVGVVGTIFGGAPWVAAAAAHFHPHYPPPRTFKCVDVNPLDSRALSMSSCVPQPPERAARFSVAILALGPRCLGRCWVA